MMNTIYIFFLKKSKLFSMLSVIFFGIFGIVGCSNTSNSSETNNVKYQYLYEKDYGENSKKIINNKDELTKQELSVSCDLTKYDETYFLNNYLLLFKFNTYYEESNLKVQNSKIINGNQLLIDISIDSPIYYEDQPFDAQISSELLFVDISKDRVTNIEKLNVGILVINSRFEDVYRSAYYDCEKMNK